MAEELFREDAYLKECDALVTRVDVNCFYTDRTVFYPVGGGQPGDSGRSISANDQVVTIVDTRKNPKTGGIKHVCEEGGDLPQVGETVKLVIDWARRHRIMRMHSCLHLLCAVIPAGVTGGQISEHRGRLDFDLEEPVDKETVNKKLNQLIDENHKMSVRWISDTDLAANPDLVRTMAVKPPTGEGPVRLVEFEDVDLQPCGGTHVLQTGEIGRVQVAKIEKKGKHNRRISVTFVD